MKFLGMALSEKQARWVGPVLGILQGGLLGLLLRFGASLKIGGIFPSVMTVAFLVLGPMAIGFITVRTAGSNARRSIWMRLVLPLPAMVVSFAMTWLFMLEGLICIAMALPITFIFAALGGLLAGPGNENETPLRNSLQALVMIGLPLVGGPLEARLQPPATQHTVENTILIHAAPATVWQHIERVAPIAPAELAETWTHRLGFPRPVEATLSYEGVGGVRHASFERGLLFIETVTRWEPEHALAFTIHADTKDLPPTTLDEHVQVGGRYFDVLDGEYRIEPLAHGDVLLHLTSHERLSTDFNVYAGLWSDAVMRTLQASILKVVQQRCEAAAGIAR